VPLARQIKAAGEGGKKLRIDKRGKGVPPRRGLSYSDNMAQTHLGAGEKMRKKGNRVCMNGGGIPSWWGVRGREYGSRKCPRSWGGGGSRDGKGIEGANEERFSEDAMQTKKS